jgi:hypothetical protein
MIKDNIKFDKINMDNSNTSIKRDLEFNKMNNIKLKSMTNMDIK